MTNIREQQSAVIAEIATAIIRSYAGNPSSVSEQNMAREIVVLRDSLIEARAERDAWALMAHERNDENKLLRTQLAAARVVTDVMVGDIIEVREPNKE